ncbi:branched-chain amino acid transaminase [candidate division KSB1 bacterium]|nr:branched-chain amino acid transaminase [candidate division KSB1 bacterium]
MDPRDEKGKIWYNGKFVNWWDAKIHVMSHALHYGSSFFEGIRCYGTPKGPAIFRLREHMQRLIDSAKIYRTEIPYTVDELMQATIDLIKVNDLQSAYIRPLAFRGYHSLGVDPTQCPVEVIIGVLNWGKYLGEEALAKGVDVRVSSWNRARANTYPSLAKAGGNYLNSQLIKLEAMADGYTEGISIDANGFVAEGSGENIFIVRDNVIHTPPAYGSPILPGITRNSAIRIATDFGMTIKESMIPRELLYVADEIFFTGTAAEVTPIRSIDRMKIGNGQRGPVTEQIQKRFFEIINGEVEDRYGWLTIIS